MLLNYNDDQGRLDKILYFTYFVFLAGFLFMSTRQHRDYYYIFVLLPFLTSLRLSDLKEAVNSKIFLLSLFYCGYMVVSLSWASGSEVGDLLNQVRRFCSVQLFLLVTIRIFSKNSNPIDKAFKYVCWFGGILAVITMWYFKDTILSGGRIVGIGTLSNAIYAGSAYGVIAIIAYCNLFGKKEIDIKQKIIYSLVIVSAIVFVILTQSRGPLLALAVVLVLSILWAKPKCCFWISGFFLFSFAVAPLLGRFELSLLIARGESYRFTIWEQSFDLLLKQPLLGYGLGGGRPDIVFAQTVASHSHNLFISNLLDGGVVAFAFLFLLLATAAYWSIRELRYSGNATTLSLIFFAVLVNLTNGRSVLVSPNYQWLCFWLPIAVAAVYELRIKRALQSGKSPCSGSGSSSLQ